MRWIDPADCLAARECLHQGHVLEAARRLLASLHREHRAARQLLLEINDRLTALAAQDFERGEILVAWEAIACAEQCATLQGEAAALKERITRARDAFQRNQVPARPAAAGGRSLGRRGTRPLGSPPT